jgi:hypothetical protein
MAETDTKTSRARGAESGDVRAAFLDAQRAYAVALQNAHLQSQRPYIEAYAGYVQAAGSAAPQEPLNAVYAYHDYVRNVLEAQQGGEAYKLYDDAYREYVGSLKKAWSSLDANAVDPASLSAIVESMRAGVAAAQSSVRS